MMSGTEGRWRWLVLLASFVVMVVNPSLNYHVGVLNMAVMDSYQSDPTLTAWLISVYASMFALAAPLASAVVNLSSCRVCVLTSGLLSFIGFVASSFVSRVEWLFLTLTLSGIGQAFGQIGGTVILAFYFPSMTSVVNGISLAGAGLGSFIHPPLLQALVDSYGLMGALAILGAFSLNSCVAGMIFRPTQHESLRRHQHNRDRGVLEIMFGDCFNHLDILKIPAFATVMLSIFTFSVAFQTVVIFLPEYTVQTLGLSPQEAAGVAAFVGIGSVVSRIFAGFAAAEQQVGATLLFSGMNAVAFLSCMASYLLFRWARGVYIVALCLGVYGSASQSLFNPLALNLLDVERTAAGYGMVLLAYGCGCLVGPPLGALLAHRLGGYVLFYFSGLMFLMTAGICASQTLCTRPTSRPAPSTDLTLKVEPDSISDRQDSGSSCLPDGHSLDADKPDTISPLIQGTDLSPDG